MAGKSLSHCKQLFPTKDHQRAFEAYIKSSGRGPWAIVSEALTEWIEVKLDGPFNADITASFERAKAAYEAAHSGRVRDGAG